MKPCQKSFVRTAGIVIRWILFIPVGCISILCAQSLAIALSTVTWWIAIPLVLFFGIVFALGGAAPVIVAPDKKIGAAMIVTLFLIFEALAILFILTAGGVRVVEFIARIYADVAICAGAFLPVLEASKKR